jgi:hypothetical protein
LKKRRDSNTDTPPVSQYTEAVKLPALGVEGRAGQKRAEMLKSAEMFEH